MKNRIIFSLFLLAAFCAAPVFAQEKSISGNQCEMLGNEDFVGEKIDVHITNIELREVFYYFIEEYGCDFAADEEIAQIRVTASLNDIPWNFALFSILESKSLSLKRTGTFESKPLFRVGDSLALSGMVCKSLEKNIDDLPLYTEIVQVKNITSKDFHNLKKYVKSRISKRGKIEVNESTKTFVITDVLENLDSIKALIKYLDEEDFNVETDENK